MLYLPEHVTGYLFIMKIFSAKQIRQLDADTILHTPISSINLMEKASEAFVSWFNTYYPSKNKVSVFCGKSNNGGDGLAIARLLIQQGYLVDVFVVEYTEKSSAEFLINLARIQEILPIKFINSIEEVELPETGSIVIDALLGTGLTRPLNGILAEVITKLNHASVERVSVDIATGLYSDSPNQDDDIIFYPHQTVSFEFPKLTFLMPQNELFTGNWHVVKIGLHPSYVESTLTPFYFTTEKTISELLKSRKRFSHKGTYGHSLIIAGSYGKIGAAVLSSGGCLRSGSGLTTMYIPNCGYQIMQISRPEVMAITDPEEHVITDTPDLSPYSSVGFGPGVGTDNRSLHALEKLIKSTSVPLVIDADGLNLLAANPALLKKLPANTILTPHPKEFERLAGKSLNDFERLETARQFAVSNQIVLVLKGANTAVISSDGYVHFNSTGNSGMATGGSGDILTGLITGLLAQHYPPLDAAIVGVYQHGLAGEIASKNRTEASVIASDIVESIGKSTT